MKIQDLECRTGLERATIRYYEREGLLNPKRLENGYREYSEEDAIQLQKIKLLRQLGMPLETIKCLQKGTTNLPSELDAWDAALSEQLRHNRCAKSICETMRRDGVDYGSMDPERYLRLFTQTPDEPESMMPVQEAIPDNIHPWRRYFARMLDYMLLGGLVNFLLFFLLRIRPIPGDLVNALLAVAKSLLFIPLEALMIHYFGTTPGKMALGMRLEDFRGGRLSMEDSFHRSVRVCFGGVGAAIPLVELITLGYNFCALSGRSFLWLRKYNAGKPPCEMYWDDKTEIIYEPWKLKSAAFLVGVAVLFGVLTGVTVSDFVKPQHRGDELTIAQFADNYNQTLHLLKEDVQRYEKLQPNGAGYPVPENVVIIGGGEHCDSFVYDTSDGYVTSISYENLWNDVFIVTPVGETCYIAAISLLMAQEDCGFAELKEFDELWIEQQNNPHVSFRYRNLEIEWDLVCENCDMYNGMLFATDQELPSSAEVTFSLILHNDK